MGNLGDQCFVWELIEGIEPPRSVFSASADSADATPVL